MRIWKSLWTYIIAGLLFLIVIIGIVEGEVYKYGVADYWLAGVIEVSLFLMGVLVGITIKKIKKSIIFPFQV